MLTRRQVEQARNRVLPRAVALTTMTLEDERERVLEMGPPGVDVGAWVATIWAIWRMEGDEASRLIADHLRETKAFADLGHLWTKAVNLVRGRALGVTQTTVQAILGLTNGEIDDLYDEWGEARAYGIADNEVLAAFGWTANETAIIYGAREREWRTQGDDRVRPTHQDVDGQIRKMNEPFLVGGALLNYPGDSSGPLVETANCRCYVVPIP